MAENDTYILSDVSNNIGEVRISDEVIAVIAGLAATEVDGVVAMAGNITNEIVGLLGMKNLSKGVRIGVNDEDVKVELALIIKQSSNIPDVSARVQDRVKDKIEGMTGLNVTDINIKIAGVDIEK